MMTLALLERDDISPLTRYSLAAAMRGPDIELPGHKTIFTVFIRRAAMPPNALRLKDRVVQNFSGEVITELKTMKSAPKQVSEAYRHYLAHIAVALDDIRNLNVVPPSWREAAALLSRAVDAIGAYLISREEEEDQLELIRTWLREFFDYITGEIPELLKDPIGR